MAVLQVFQGKVKDDGEFLMTDLKAGVNQLFLREEELRRGMELLFFAYRDFTAEADLVLRKLGLGRAHHRMIYFVGRHPGLSVSDLLSILKITKQSLSRVLGELVRDGYIIQNPGTKDRRQRLLDLTEKGYALERQLFESQKSILARSYRDAGGEAVDGFRHVLSGMILRETDRAKLSVPGGAKVPDLDRT